MRVRVDQRSRDVLAAPEAERAAREACREIARAEVRAARALATIERGRSYVRLGFGSIHSWAAHVGFGPQQARRLLALGRALAAAPELGSKVRSGEVASESAVSVGKVLLEPALKLEPAEKQAWVERASALKPRALRDVAEKAVEEARQGEPTLPLRLVVTKQAKDGFFRARLLMSKGKPRWITEGETFGGLVDYWLARHDPRRKPLPARRCGPTQGRRRRYVPRRVAAIVERRSGGICEVCHVKRATQKIHLETPHAKGGGAELNNLADACGDCHVLVDAGVFRLSRFDRNGRPQWNYHPDVLYGPLQGRHGPPTRVRERPPCYYYLSGAPAGFALHRARSGAVRRQRAPPLRGCTD